MSALSRVPVAVAHLRRELGEIAAIPDLGRYWIGQLVSKLGSNATWFVLMTSVYLETGSVVWFALLYALDNVPDLVLSPVAGTLVDKYDRRLLHVIGDGGVALVTVATLFLWSTDQLSVTAIFSLILIGSSFEVLQDAAGEAMFQQMVPKDKLVRASAVMGPFDELIEVLAPAIGVTLLAIANAGVVFTLDLITFAFALWTLFTFSQPERFRSHMDDGEDDNEDEEGSVRFFLQGLQYLRAHSGLKFIFFYGLIDDFLSAIVLLLAATAALELGGEEVLAIVQSSAGAGAILGMVLIAVFGLFRGQIIRHNVIMPGLLIGVCLLLVPFVSNATALAIGAFVFMLLSAPLDAALHATYLAAAPPKLFGRISAVFDVATGIANLVVLLGVAQFVEHIFVPLLEENPLDLGALGSVGGANGTLDAQLIMIGLAGLGMLLLNLRALSSKSRIVADELAKEIETQPTYQTKYAP